MDYIFDAMGYILSKIADKKQTQIKNVKIIIRKIKKNIRLNWRPLVGVSSVNVTDINFVVKNK